MFKDLFKKDKSGGADAQTPPSQERSAEFARPEVPADPPSSSGIAGLHQRHDDEGAPPPRSGVVQNDVNDSVYKMRAEQVARIDAMFGEFGPAVSSYLLTQSLMPGGIKRLVQKLELQSRGREGADLALIANWITEAGTATFCQKVGLRQHVPTPSQQMKRPDSVAPMRRDGTNVRASAKGRPGPGSGKGASLTTSSNTVKPLDLGKSDEADESQDTAARDISRNARKPKAPDLDDMPSTNPPQFMFSPRNPKKKPEGGA